MYDASTSSSRMNTSRKLEYTNPHLEINNLQPNHYFITGIMDQRKYLILINTGQEENLISKEIVLEKDIIIKEHSCPDLPKILTNIEEITEKEFIIGGIPMVIQLKLYQWENRIILGIKWLDTLKPYSLEDKQLIITYQNKKIIINRTIIWQKYIY